MKVWVLIVIIIVAFVIGYYSYKFIPYNYTPNIPPILELANDELNALSDKLKKDNLSENEKQEIINRQNEIYELLKEFFGTDIRITK